VHLLKLKDAVFYAPARRSLLVKRFASLYLAEIAWGIAYTNDYIDISFALRPDGNGDGEYNSASPIGPTNGEKGGNIQWRANPKIINKLVPAFSVWANGYVTGLPIGVPADDISPNNEGRSESYLYTVFKTGNFEAKLTTGLFTFNSYNTPIAPGVVYWVQNDDAELLLKPRVTYNITPLIAASMEAPITLALSYGDDYKIDGKDPKAFSKLVLEPKIAISLPGAIVYNGTTLAGVTITPLYHFERSFAGAAAAAGNANSNGGKDNVDLHRFEIRFTFAF
jgi:hypothetical protein